MHCSRLRILSKMRSDGFLIAFMRRWPFLDDLDALGTHARVSLLAGEGSVLCLLGLALIAQTVRAQFMLSPVAVTESGFGTFSPTEAPLGAMIDQSGLNVPFVSGTTDFDSYFVLLLTRTSQKTPTDTKWQSDVLFDLPFAGTPDFDLGDSYNVSKVAIYNVSVKR